MSEWEFAVCVDGWIKSNTAEGGGPAAPTPEEHDLIAAKFDWLN